MLASIIAESEAGYTGKMPIPVELFAEGEPTADVWVSGEFAATANLRTGIWLGQPGKINIPAYPTDEVFTVISGEIQLLGADGSNLTVGPGVSCLMRKGWAGVWHTVKTTRKCYVVFAV